MSLYDGLGRHADVELGGRVAPRLVDQLAALLVERKPRDVHRAVRRRHLEARPPAAAAVRRHPDIARRRRPSHAARLLGAVHTTINRAECVVFEISGQCDARRHREARPPAARAIRRHADKVGLR